MKVSSFIRFSSFGINTILFRRKKPILGTIILTDRCNLTCKHCAVNNITSIIHPYQQIRSEMEELYAQGIRILFLCGGETFLWRDQGKSVNDLVREAKEMGFLIVNIVTNGTFPHVLRDLDPLPTQLYISLDAPNEDIYRKLCLPKTSTGWQKLMETVDLLPSLDTRIVGRHTLVKGYNLGYEEEYAALDLRGEVDFIEPKGYVFVGYSRERLSMDNMPSFDDIRAFAARIRARSSSDTEDSSPASSDMVSTTSGKMAS